MEGDGTVDVTDTFHDRVQALTNTDTETVLPFAGLDEPTSVAVDNAGTLYVADRINDRVVALAASAKTQSEPPFTGLKSPEGVAVDNARTVTSSMRATVGCSSCQRGEQRPHIRIQTVSTMEQTFRCKRSLPKFCST